MIIGLNGESLVSPLPDVARGLVTNAMPLYMRCEQPLHPPAHIAVFERTDDEMQVIRHETPGEKIDAKPLLSGSHEIDEHRVVIADMKDRRASVTASDNVSAHACRYETRATRHVERPSQGTGGKAIAARCATVGENVKPEVADRQPATSFRGGLPMIL